MARERLHELRPETRNRRVDDLSIGVRRDLAAETLWADREGAVAVIHVPLLRFDHAPVDPALRSRLARHRDHAAEEDQLDPRQLVFRPRAAIDPYTTGIPGVYLCSAATPPGAGAHGMCGYNAAQSALRRLDGRSNEEL